MTEQKLTRKLVQVHPLSLKTDMNATKVSRGYVNACGRLNLRTGKNLHFNILHDWANSKGLLLTLFALNGKPVVIGGCGEYEEDEEVDLFGSQTHRPQGRATVVYQVSATAEGMATIRHTVGGNTVRFGTWD